MYKTKAKKFHGSNFREVHQQAVALYRQICKGSKRRPHVRSAYFGRQKIFLELFWRHIYEKPNFRDKVRRLKYFACAIELLKHSRFDPESKENPNRRSEMLHRFAGITPENELFCVQVKEDKRKDEKWFMSVFPVGK